MSRSSQKLPQCSVVITGASAGVGRAVALRFARAGAHLALIARDAEALHRVKEEVECRGGTAMVVPLDVADAAAVFNAADEIVRARGSERPGGSVHGAPPWLLPNSLQSRGARRHHAVPPAPQRNLPHTALLIL